MFNEAITFLENNFNIDINNIKETLILWLDNINDWYALYIAVFTIILIAVVYINYKKHINNISLKIVNRNIQNKKYIADLYVELGNTHEKLRYFIHRKKWISKIKRDFFSLFNNNVGRLIEKRYNVKFKINDNYNNVQEHIENMNNVIEELRKSRSEENIDFYLSNHSYSYKYEIEDLLEYKDLINKNVCFVLGEAGSGKTNLMSKIANLIINNFNMHCIFINSRNVVDNDIEKFFYEFFYTKFLINSNSEKLIRIYLSILSLLKKNLFVIIEAINENENPDFILRILNFIDKYNKYENIKFIITSRSEFFDIKYRKCIEENFSTPYKLLKIDKYRFNENSVNRMFIKYSKYFNFKGKTSKSVESMLKNSPILIRMFFECYRGSSEIVNDLNKFELFNYYINKLQNNYKNISLEQLLFEIAENMIKNERYDYVKINEITNKEDISNTLIYENVLLDKSIIEEKDNIKEHIENVISFTFDEMRDFILSKYILSKYNEKELFLFLDNIKSQNKNVIEGILRYIYIYFKSAGDLKTSEQILKKYAGDNVNFNQHNRNDFGYLGLQLIFDQYKPLEEYELNYILYNSFYETDIENMIDRLVTNTLSNINPNIEIIINEVIKLNKDDNYKSNFLIIGRDQYKEILERYDITEEDARFITLIKIIKHGRGYFDDKKI